MNADQILSPFFDSHYLLKSCIEDSFAHLKALPEKDAELHLSHSYRVGRHISELSDEIIILERDSVSHGAPILLRSMLESMFSIGAAVKSGAFMAEILLNEINRYLTKNRQYIEQKEIEGLEAFQTEFSQQYNIPKSGKYYKIYQIAKKAGLTDLYGSIYSILCNHTHGSLSGIIASEGDSEVHFRCRILQFSVICAATSGLLAQIVRFEKAQTTIDKAASLIDECNAESFIDNLNALPIDEIRACLSCSVD